MVSPYYAVKCNPEPYFLKSLYAAGVNFDCASEREMREVQLLGLDNLIGRVVYANPCKSARDVRAARGVGSPTTVVDSAEELEKLGEYEGGALVRIAVDDKGSAMPFSTKFGCARMSDLADIAIVAGKRGVPLKGVSFHVGSGCGKADAYGDAIRSAYEALNVLRMLGHGGASTIDLGGGYIAQEEDFKAKAEVIRKTIRAVNLRERYAEPLKWIAEPGRFFAANAFDLFVQVIGKKGAGGQGYKYTLDESLYGQFSGILFDHATPNWVRVAGAGGPRKRSSGVLFGRTCDSVDVIARSEDMEELEVGDWLWFPNMGAYARATASEFNGFPTPPVFLEKENVEVDAIEKIKGALDVKRMPAVSVKGFWETGGGGTGGAAAPTASLVPTKKIDALSPQVGC